MHEELYHKVEYELRNEIVNRLMPLLCKCQIIDVNDVLYSILNDIEDEDMIYLQKVLNSAGYHLTYNNNDDCFIVH